MSDLRSLGGGQCHRGRVFCNKSFRPVRKHSIQGPDSLRTGESAQYYAIRVRMDGSQEKVLAQWSVTAPYLTIEASNGIAVGGTPGIAELRASVDGISAVQAIRVVPDMRGTSVEQKFTNAWGYQHYAFKNVLMTLKRQP